MFMIDLLLKRFFVNMSRQHCLLTISIELVELTNSVSVSVSDDKIQITILILRRGALSTLEQSKKSRNLFHNQIEGLNARTTVPQKYDFLSVALPVSQFLPNDFEGIMLLLPLLTS